MSKNQDSNPAEQQVIEAIRGIKYGAVEVLIHDSRVVQVAKTEKLRFDQPRNGN